MGRSHRVSMEASAAPKRTESLDRLFSNNEYRSRQALIDKHLYWVTTLSLVGYALLVSAALELSEGSRQLLPLTERTAAAAASGACFAAALAAMIRLRLQK